MSDLIKRLFGKGTSKKSVRENNADDLIVKRELWSDKSSVSDVYFRTMEKMQEAISKRNYEKAGRLVRENLEYIPRFVRETCAEYGSFDISSIPALQQGGTILALLNDNGGLVRMREIVASIPELLPWVENVERHQHDLHLFQAILDAVKKHPNCLQTEVKGLVGEADGRRVTNLISYLDKAGKIVRIKTGRAYNLLPSDSPDVPTPPPKRVVGSHRTHQNPPRLNEIDISSLSYVPLPRAPMRWEAQADSEQKGIPEPQNYFEVHDADWSIIAIEKIPLEERPDTAFRQMHPTDSGLFIIDDLGNADGLGQIEAAALRYDRNGKLVAKKGFQHGIYRVGVHPLGCGLVGMSKDCVLHAYDDKLELFLETLLTEAPEILPLIKRFEIQEDQLKNHIRCVALSRNATRYLFTAVDEAWCVDMAGKGLWGVKMPLQEGWTRVATPSGEFGTSDEVSQALSLMGLSLPLMPQDLKLRYYELAKQLHPDLNPEDSQAHDKMKALNAAAEVLTGVDARSLPEYAGATFVSEMESMAFEVDGETFTLSFGMSADEAYASDWIYAAGFAANSDASYIASYSGRVVLINEKGEGVRVYDIGSVPHRIVDTGDYLYLLTGTRLYVLRDDALHALVDTFDGGDLIVAQTGFGLLEKKRLRWFHEDGKYLGSVISKDPIRRVYSKGNGIVVETRQRRAFVQGVSAWWE